MQNANDATTLVVDRVFDWVVPAINKAVAAAAAEAKHDGPDPGWDKYVGKYSSSFRDARVLVYRNKLVLINPAVSDPTSSMFTLVPVGKDTFRMEGSGWGTHGELLSFEFGGDGEVLRIKIAQNYMYPVD